MLLFEKYNYFDIVPVKHCVKMYKRLDLNVQT
jgi:hypothetical protein